MATATNQVFPIQGSKFFMSTGLGTAKAISSISNASPPVVSCTGHGFVDNNEVIIFNDQEDVDSSIYRVDSLTTDTFSLPGYDLSDVDFYPIASSGGNAQIISGWLELGLVTAVTTNGGGVKYTETPIVNRRRPIKQPTGFEASTLEFVLAFNKNRSDQQALQATSRVLGQRAFKFVLAGPSYFYCYGTVSMSKIPDIQDGQVLKRKVSISIDGDFTGF